MFRKFFQALSALTLNTETLAASMAEANARFRENLALDQEDSEPAALPAPSVESLERARNGKARTKASV